MYSMFGPPAPHHSLTVASVSFRYAHAIKQQQQQQDYNASLSRIRSFLAGSTRNRTTLTECERLLHEARQCATAMQTQAADDPLRVQEAQQRLERDIAPLAREVSRQLQEIQRQEEQLFYRPPSDVEHHGSSNNNNNNNDSSMMMQSLIQSSDDLLRESQSILVETEYIGNQTLQQMGRQREQLHHTHASLAAVQQAAGRAHVLLRDMSRRACRSRLALYTMIACLGAANVWVLYAIYKKHHPTPKPNGDF